MSEEAGQGQVPRKKIRITKQIVPFEQSSPVDEPLFINYAQVAHAGGSAYIDVGVIPLDDIVSQESEEATFLVLNRLVMSRETLAGLPDQISSLLSSPVKQLDIEVDIVSKE